MRKIIIVVTLVLVGVAVFLACSEERIVVSDCPCEAGNPCFPACKPK